MEFTIEKVMPTGIRVGKLTGASSSVSIETPACLPHTRGGFVPYLTPDIVQSLEHKPPSAMLTMATMFKTPGTLVLTKYGKGIHKFLSMEDTLLYMGVQDPCHHPSSSYNDTKTISIWNPGGRTKVNVKEYMSLVEAFQPDIFEALCDTASSLENEPKRIRKSVDRTLEFLDQSLEIMQNNENFKHISILGAIQGSDLIDERTRSAKETAIRPVDGYVLEGFQLATNFDSLKTLMMSVVDILPYHKPRFIHGPYQPSEIFEAIECGIDVFDTSHALSATERGLALVYPNGLGFNKRELCSLGNENIIEIDLNNDKYRDSHQPLLDGCNCYTCSNYKSSYIHHLLVTKEMMAGILLMIHNFSHIFKFFHNLRLSIATNRYMEFKSTVLTA